jgi:transcriptional regulator GlxA family with amidase domain
MIYEPPYCQMLETVGPFFDQLCPKPFKGSRDIDWRTERVREFIDHHPTKAQGNLGGVCKQLGLSMSDRQIRQLFIKDSAGVGIRCYAKNRRLVIAAGQLKTTEIPVKAIALDAGYRSTCHFARSFKRLFHLSPTEFRGIWNRKLRTDEHAVSAA